MDKKGNHKHDDADSCLYDTRGCLYPMFVSNLENLAWSSILKNLETTSAPEP